MLARDGVHDIEDADLAGRGLLRVVATVPTVRTLWTSRPVTLTERTAVNTLTVLHDSAQGAGEDADDE